MVFKNSKAGPKILIRKTFVIAFILQFLLGLTAVGTAPALDFKVKPCCSNTQAPNDPLTFAELSPLQAQGCCCGAKVRLCYVPQECSFKTKAAVLSSQPRQGTSTSIDGAGAKPNLLPPLQSDNKRAMDQWIADIGPPVPLFLRNLSLLI